MVGLWGFALIGENISGVFLALSRFYHQRSNFFDGTSTIFEQYGL